jgi:hypothetical protein
MPLVHIKHPRKTKDLAMRPLAIEGGGSGQNSGDPAPESAGERVEDG